MPGANAEAVEQIFRLARRADHQGLRPYLHDDVTWHPAKEGAWKPCENADDVVYGNGGASRSVPELTVVGPV